MGDETPHPRGEPRGKIGSYEIVAPIGAGGMGEVYRAKDLKLDREVALKLLPDAFVSDPHRMARFEREARVLASLNHPNIGHIYGLEEAGGVKALVLELVEGPTLADRIAQGPIPAEEAVPIARQIAEALEAAHERGIVHRDLKPANVKVKRDGTVKVLDFGLAKAFQSEAGPDSSVSPTQTAATHAGVILGTAAYMAPEQASGRPVDKRADIWAFGAVLFEMLSGRPVFRGDTFSEILASVLKDDVDWSALSAETPAHVRRVLVRCLERDPRRRLRDIGEARIAFEEPASVEISETRTTPRSMSHVVWAATVVLAVALGWVAALRLAGGSDAPSWVGKPVQFTFGPPEGTVFDSSLNQPFELSPDGSALAFIAVDASGTHQLWVREFNSDLPRRLHGTDGAWAPFWSPDGEWIGFYAPGALKRVRTAGGEPATITTIPGGDFSTAAWGPDGTILFHSAWNEGPLERIPYLGGTASPVGSRGETQKFPSFLKDGKRFIYKEEGTVYVAGPSGIAERIVHDGPIRGRIAYSPGYLFHFRDEALVVSEFDERSGSLSSETPRLVEGIPVSGPWRTPYSVSRNGVLAFQRNAAGYETILAWFDRDGNRLDDAVRAPRRYRGYSVSPDGGRIAYSLFADDGSTDIWVRDLKHGSEDRWTSHGDALRPVWSSNGAMLAFKGSLDVFVASGIGEGKRLTNVSENDTVSNYVSLSWNPTSDSIVCSFLYYDGSEDLGTLRLDGSSAEPLPINTEFNERDGTLSPDGEWIAYATDRTGQSEVWVARYPTGEYAERISVSGGSYPQWTRGGRELLFVSGGNTMMAAPIDLAGSPVLAAAPTELFPLENNVGLFGGRSVEPYSATADGNRFLIPLAADVPQPPIHVILNWPALLEE